MGKWQAHVASEVLGGGNSAGSTKLPARRRVIFTEPQIAAVGLSLQAATDSGRQARAYDVPTSGTAGASFYGRNVAGTSRIVVDEERGCHRRGHIRGHRCSRLAAGRDDRNRKLHPDRARVAGSSRLSDQERGLVEVA